MKWNKYNKSAINKIIRKNKWKQKKKKSMPDTTLYNIFKKMRFSEIFFKGFLKKRLLLLWLLGLQLNK